SDRAPGRAGGLRAVRGRAARAPDLRAWGPRHRPPKPGRGATDLPARARDAARRDCRAAPVHRRGDGVHGIAEAGLRRRGGRAAGDRRRGAVTMDRDERDNEATVPTTPRRRARGWRWMFRGLLALLLVSLGVAAGVMWGERRSPWLPVAPEGRGPQAGAAAKGGDATRELPAPERSGGDATTTQEEPVEGSLTPEAGEGAGLKTVPV